MKLIEHLVRQRLKWLIGTLLVLALAASQMLHMAFNGDIKVMFEKDNHYLKLLEQFDERYQQSSYLLIMLEPADRNIYSSDNLRLIDRITRSAAELPHAVRVDSLTTYPRVRVQGDSLSVDALLDGDRLQQGEDVTPLEMAALKSYAESDQQVLGKLVSRQGNAAAVVITVALPQPQLESQQELMDAANRLKQELLQDYPGLTLHFNGDAAIEDAILQVTMEDMLWVNPLVFTTIFLLVGFFLRSRVAIVSTVAVVAVSTFMSMGILVMLGFDINPITMMAPAVIMVLAVLDSVHIMTQYIINLGQGMDKLVAMKSSLRKNASPVFWTSATDAVGFLSMNFGDSPPFRDMGNMAAIGVMIAFVVTYTVLPGVALLFSDRIEAKPLVLAGLMRKMTGMVLRIHGVILWGVLAAIVFLGFSIPALNVNDDLATYFDDSLEIQDSLEFARNNIEGVQFILYSLGGEEAGQVNDPVFLQRAEQFELWLEQQPEVSSVDSYLDLLRRINQAMHDGDVDEARLPDNRELAAQYLLLYEMSLPEGMDLTRDLSEDRSSLRMVVNVRKSDNQTLIGLEQRAEQWLQQNDPDLRAEASSEILMFAHMGTSIILSMMDGSLFTLLFVTAMMMIGLRSFKFGLISMIPNVAPPIVIYGLWTLTVGQVNHAVAMTFSITMGLIVDDTIHLMSKYLNGRREGLSPEQAITESLATSGAAVVVSSLTLGAGFLLLSLSRFTVNDTLSIMTASIIFMALAFDLIFLPALLVQLDRFLTGRDPVPVMANPDANT